MDPVLERLRSGVRRFRSEVFPGQERIFRQAASSPQRPHTLFITCADSRIDPNQITGTGTGEVFVTRNVGNMVPPYGEMLGGVSAVIEFAVSALHVQHIAVCGHSDCGAMKALIDPDSLGGMPTVASWLKNAHAALPVARTLTERKGDSEALLPTLTEQNVLLQMGNLRTHPSVAGAMARGELTMSGWVYEIGTGEVRISTGPGHDFAPVEAREAEPTGASLQSGS